MLATLDGIGWQLSVDRKIVISVMKRDDGSYHLRR